MATVSPPPPRTTTPPPPEPVVPSADVEPTEAPRQRRRTWLWVIWIAVLVALAAGGLLLVVAAHGSRASNGSAGAVGFAGARCQGHGSQPRASRHRGAGAQGHHRRVPQRARHGHAAQSRHRQAARRRPAHEDLFRGRPASQGGTAARRYRPAPVRSAARAGAGTAREGPGAARQCASRPRSLQDAAVAGFDRQAAGRHAGVARAPIPGDAQGRSSRGRPGEAAAHVREGHRAHQRTRRPAPGRSRQRRASLATPTASS